MKTLRYISILAVLIIQNLLATNLVYAESKAEAIGKLDKLLQDFKALERYAMRLDLGGLMVLEKRTTVVKELVDKKDIGNMSTLIAYQDLCLMLKYSTSFLASVHTADTDTQIRDIMDINEQIIKDRGFDETIVTQLVAGILSEMHTILMQIKGQGASEQFENWLYVDDGTRDVNNPQIIPKSNGFVHHLAAERANAMANGDVPSSYEAGARVATKLRLKYNDLMNINSRSAAYQMVTQLLGLNEFFFEIYTRGGYKGKMAASEFNVNVEADDANASEVTAPKVTKSVEGKGKGKGKGHGNK